MAKRNVEIVILCEDTQQDVFVRQWLESRGLNKRKFRIFKNPGGGSAEQFVRSRYADEVAELRRLGTHRPVGRSLITMIDADTFTVQERHDVLDESLGQAEQERRGGGEKIAILVPKRNIETWIHFLAGEDVNENDGYRKLDKASDCKADVVRFVAARPDSLLKTSAPESLQFALIEMERIF